jgi:hypothetical protein
MAQKDNILQELNELQSILMNASSQNVYQVPSGYFEDLAGQVLNRIKALEARNAAEELNYLSPLLSSVSKKTPFSIPSDFFDTLDEKIIHAVKDKSDELTPAEELETLSPLLNGLKKEMPVRTVQPGWPYSIPEGYFENIIVAPVIQPQAKVVSITRQKWFRYAAAAIVTGFIVTAGFLIFKNDKIDPNTQSSEWVNKNMKKVSTEDINEFVQLVDEETPVIASIDSRSEIKDKNDVQELIKDIPDEEIQDFLDETQTEETDSNDDLLLN